MEIKIFLRLKDGDLQELKSTIKKLEKDLIDGYQNPKRKDTKSFFVSGMTDDYSITALEGNGK
jgi:hypothetical protein